MCSAIAAATIGRSSGPPQQVASDQLNRSP
jgi:hypothetical protein